MEPYLAGAARARGGASRQRRRHGLELYGPGEVIPGHEFYDYADKYTAGAARTIAHAPGSTPARGRRCRRIAPRRVSRSSAAEGFARVDFLLDRATGRLYLNEINTIPGFTPISLFPMMAEAGGFDFAALCAPDRRTSGAARRAPPARPTPAPADLPR